MKTLFAMLVIVASQASFGADNSLTLEQRHQQMIEQAVFNQCGGGQVIESASDVTYIDVDQGIRDAKYTTILRVFVGKDQYDEFEATVKSEYADMYDHNTKNWGVYSVTNVLCNNQ